MRAALITLMVALAAGAALLFPLSLAPALAGRVQAVELSVHIGAMCWSMAWFGQRLQRRYPAKKLQLVFGQLFGGAAVAGLLALSWSRGIGLRESMVPWTFPLAVAGGAASCAGLFSAAGLALMAVTRRATSVRVRAAAFTFACATIAVLFYAAMQSTMPSDGLFWVALPILIAASFSFGLSGSFSRSLTAPISAAADALSRVSRGDLEVRLEESGRDELSTLARTFNQMTRGLKERAFLERAFGQYVAPSVLEALRQQNALALSAERREASVLFADVRGFTAFSESTTPEDVLHVLNVYLEQVVEIVARHGGYLNKFIGDAVMVVFNAPMEHPDHADRVLRCARDIQQEVARLKAAQAFGAGREVRIGVGVNSGTLVAGTLGSDRRAEYTVIGDTVNTASRLCSAAKAGEILVGARTRALLRSPERLEPIAPLTVKGKAHPLEVFRLAPLDEEASSSERRRGIG